MNDLLLPFYFILLVKNKMIFMVARWKDTLDAKSRSSSTMQRLSEKAQDRI